VDRVTSADIVSRTMSNWALALLASFRIDQSCRGKIMRRVERPEALPQQMAASRSAWPRPRPRHAGSTTSETSTSLGSLLSRRRGAALEPLLAIKVLLLIAGAALAIRLGPFHDGDSWRAVLTGMTLVAAMAVQNAVHRIHLGSVPPSTLMTGTTTQIMIDLADLVYPDPTMQTHPGSKLGLMSLNVVVFALGCGAAALLFLKFGVWCFVWPPLLGALALVVRLADRDEALGARKS